MPACDGQVQPCVPIKTTRTRHMELVKIANEIIEKIIDLGINKDEYCYFGNIVSQMIQLPKE